MRVLEMKRRFVTSTSIFLLFAGVIFCTIFSAPLRGALLYTSAQYAKLYNEKVALELELQTLKRQYSNDRTNLEATIRELNNKIDTLTKELGILRKQQDSDRALAAKRIKELEDMADILKKTGGEKENQLIEENRKLQKRYEDELAKLRNELKGEREKYLKELAELKSDYERKISGLNKEIAGLNNDLSELQKLSEKQKEELDRMEDQAKEIEKKLAEEIKKGEITLKRFHDKLIINIDDKICFDSGSSELKKDVMPALQKITAILVSYPENRIIVEGDTDNVPISTARFRDNWQLSTERALSVLNYLLRDKKLNPTRFSAAGYGEYNPILPNNTAANRALNRRVDIVVVPRLAASKK
jgi:chemotaxis protein MotB